MLRRGCVHMLALALWLVASMHCRLSALPALEFLACAEPHDEATHEHPPKPGSHGDPCGLVESASYRAEEEVSTPAAQEQMTIPAPVLEPAVAPSIARAAPPSLRSSQADPPQADSWHLRVRAAGTPRAPSVGS